MFEKKRFPHCENLTPKQEALVRKIVKCEYSLKFRARCQAALEKGWPEVLVAALKQKRMARRDSANDIYGIVMTAQATDAWALIMPLLAGQPADAQINTLCTAIYYGWADAWPGILAHVPSADIRTQALSRALGYSRGDDHGESARMIAMLDEGVNLHAESGILMKRALVHGRLDVAGALVSKGFDLGIYGAQIGADPTQSLPYESLCFLQDRLHKAATAVDNAQGPDPSSAQVQDAGFAAVTEESITRIETLPTGGRLSIVFNFRLRQQIVVAETPGPSAAVTVVQFADMTDDHPVLVAAQAFLQAGGAPEYVAHMPRLAPGAASGAIIKSR